VKAFIFVDATHSKGVTSESQTGKMIRFKVGDGAVSAGFPVSTMEYSLEHLHFIQLRNRYKYFRSPESDRYHSFTL
jgi:hypothetical protein